MFLFLPYNKPPWTQFHLKVKLKVEYVGLHPKLGLSTVTFIFSCLYNLHPNSQSSHISTLSRNGLVLIMVESQTYSADSAVHG